MWMMVLFVSSLVFFFHSSESLPLKGCVCEAAESTVNATRLINTLQIIRIKHTSTVYLTHVCLCECRHVVQLDLKEGERAVLEEECVKLEKDLSMMEEPGDVSVLSVVFPLVGASVFITLLLLSITMFKGHESQAGGVLGSLIHYPPQSLKNTKKQGSLLPAEAQD